FHRLSPVRFYLPCARCRLHPFPTRRSSDLSNDPMAIFLTVGLIEVLLGRTELGFGLVTFFLQQMVVGGLAGLAVGRLAVMAVNRVNLEAAGMYPLVVSASGLVAYGIAAALGGSGFLAVFI